MSRSGTAEELKLFSSFIQYSCAFFSLFSHSFLPHLLSHNFRAGSACYAHDPASKKTVFTCFSNRNPLASRKQTPICCFPIFKCSKTPQVDILCPSEKNHSRFFPVSCWRHLAKAVKQFSLVSFGLLSGRLSLIITIRLVKERVTPGRSPASGKETRHGCRPKVVLGRHPEPGNFRERDSGNSWTIRPFFMSLFTGSPYRYLLCVSTHRGS